jgi:hypothetical protein
VNFHQLIADAIRTYLYISSFVSVFLGWDLFMEDPRQSHMWDNSRAKKIFSPEDRIRWQKVTEESAALI